MEVLRTPTSAGQRLLQVWKSRCRTKVKISRFDILKPSCPRKRFRNKLNDIQVGHRESDFRMFDGFLGILVLSLGLVLMHSVIISKS